MSVDDFIKSVDDGIRLSKRLYFGKDRAVAPPKPPPSMERSPQSYLPNAPMVYAVIPDPSIVDNPDIPSYQPHVHGRCDPPALIPLQMNNIDLKADCYLDTAFIYVSGTWRVHCIMGSKACDCRIAVPMGEQGSILGVEVTIPRKSYTTKFIYVEDGKDVDKAARPEDGGFLKANTFTLKIPQVDGGSNLSVKISWSQKLLFSDGQYTLSVPFAFPEFVTPVGKKMSKKEKIEVNVNPGTKNEVLCKTTSHPFKEFRRNTENLGFLYEAEVLTWSNIDVNLSYAVSSHHIIGNLLLQSPAVDDVDQREMFCLYLLPGSQNSVKFLRKDIIFVVDISGSMRGRLLEDTKNALSASLQKLGPEDSFSILAFNSAVYQSSTSLELATPEAVDKAIQWIDTNFVIEDGTNILNPLNKAIEMLSDCHDSVPIIFLITDGTVEDERYICNVMKSKLSNGGSIHPRIFTFGIGTFCNHHFLRMLATIGRGLHDAAYDVDSIKLRMDALFLKAASPVLANIDIDMLEDLEIEMHPSCIPDLSSECPLIVFGRYSGHFPEELKVRGIMADLSACVIDMKIHKAKNIPVDKICAKQQIDHLTAQSWFSEEKVLEEKIKQLSIQNNVASEFTRMILQETYEGTKVTAGSEKNSKGGPRTITLRSLCIGYGDLEATKENVSPGLEQVKLPEAAEILVKAAFNCCGIIFGRCCCMCCIQCCSRLNDQFVIALTQLCSALAFFGCMECCSELCCGGNDS
ncbi:hypothetical protein SAY87_007003 [Trapa incisa]|uniref:VWFA domain-containing protein n=1 Tax=Trapa incisa TaxID=236973 RepID=A0AAN7K092_9MYRT|nr:hypothetical protein SAY87_007003 [Trapa incisa]